MSTFSKSTVYHSELVKKGPLTVRFKDDPLKSKFPKEGATHIAFFTVEGDDSEYTLTIEDSALTDVENAPNKTWITMEAVGSRDTARLHFHQSDEDKARPEPAPKPAPQSDLSLHALMDKLLRVSLETIDEVAADASPDARLDCATRLAASLFIEHNRRS